MGVGGESSSLWPTVCMKTKERRVWGVERGWIWICGIVINLQGGKSYKSEVHRYVDGP